MTHPSTRRLLVPLACAGVLAPLMAASPAVAASDPTPSSGSNLASTSTLAGASVASAATNRGVASAMVRSRGWSRTQFTCLVRLWSKESGWNHRAQNRSSGAYGIPQALPGSKMRSAGADWRTNPATQIKWGLGYISSRYRTPCAAWQHSQRVGWY